MKSNRIQNRIMTLTFTAFFVVSLAAPTAAMAHCKGKHAGGDNLPTGHESCDGGGGSNDGNDSGEAIPQNCFLLSEANDSILNDPLGIYSDDVDKVRCTTGGTSQPNPSSLLFSNITRGNLKNAIRKVDLFIDINSCSNLAGCAVVPAGVFLSAESVDDMENISMNVRAYAGTDALAVPHIPRLTPGKFYEAAFNFTLKGTAERWSFQMMSEEIPDDFHQGTFCDLEDPSLAKSEDVTLYVWPDFDQDGVPDGYSVTTADPNPEYVVSEVDGIPVLPPIFTKPQSRTATLCSNIGIDGSDCGGAGSSALCHLISQMDVQFTWHAESQ
jgi:hypothetical protein